MSLYLNSNIVTLLLFFCDDEWHDHERWQHVAYDDVFPVSSAFRSSHKATLLPGGCSASNRISFGNVNAGSFATRTWSRQAKRSSQAQRVWDQVNVHQGCSFTFLRTAYTPSTRLCSNRPGIIAIPAATALVRPRPAGLAKFRWPSLSRCIEKWQDTNEWYHQKNDNFPFKVSELHPRLEINLLLYYGGAY